MSPSVDIRPKTTQRRWTASPGATRDADRHRGDSLWHRRQTGPGIPNPESTRIRSHTRQVPETRTILPEKPDRAHAHGRRGRRGLRPPSADSQERRLSSTAQPPAPAVDRKRPAPARGPSAGTSAGLPLQPPWCRGCPPPAGSQVQPELLGGLGRRPSWSGGREGPVNGSAGTRRGRTGRLHTQTLFVPVPC